MARVLFSLFLGSQSLFYGSIAYLAFRQRAVRYHYSFGLLQVALCIYSLGSLMEIQIGDSTWVRFWNNFVYSGMLFLGPLWLILSMEYAGLVKSKQFQGHWFFCLVPFLVLCLKFADDSLHWCYQSSELSSRFGVYLLGFVPGPLYYLHIGYSLLCLLAGLILFVWTLANCTRGSKSQALWMVLGGLAPLVFLVFYLLFREEIGIDIIPTSFLVTSLVFFIALRRSRFLQAPPVLLQSVYRSMASGFLVFDLQGRLIEYNPAARRLFPILSTQRLPLGPEEVSRVLPEIMALDKEGGGPVQGMTLPQAETILTLRCEVCGVTDSRGFREGRIVFLQLMGSKTLETRELRQVYQQVLDRLEELLDQEKPYLSPDITLPDLAARLGVPRGTLSLLLNSLYGESFPVFINSRRIEEAKSVLRQKRMCIQDLVFYSGFNSRTAFYAAFKRHTGLPPLAWAQTEGLEVEPDCPES